MSLLEIRDLCGGYCEVDILNGIDLAFDPAEILGVIRAGSFVSGFAGLG